MDNTVSIENSKTMTIIVTKGSLDWAYPPFILATTAAAMDVKVDMFFTFYGLQLLKKDLDHLQISTLGNPGMEMPMFGMHMKMPNIVSAIPGADALCSTMMQYPPSHTSHHTIDNYISQTGLLLVRILTNGDVCLESHFPTEDSPYIEPRIQYICVQYTAYRKEHLEFQNQMRIVELLLGYGRIYLDI